MRMTQIERQTLGDEPKFIDGGTYSEVLHAYNWYSYFYTVSDARGFVIDYMQLHKFSADDINDFKRIKDEKIGLTLCSTCRMVMNGAVLDYNIRSQINNLLTKYRNELIEAPVVVKLVSNPLIEKIDHALDVFYDSGYTEPFSLKESITESSLGLIRGAIDHVSALMEELTSNHPDVKEAYDHLTRRERKTYIAQLEALLADLTQSKINQKRTTPRKPRKKKQKTATDITKKVKYQIADKELEITSLPPSWIVGCATVWTFNTKTRKLAKYSASENATLTIKGTTIIGYDDKNSIQKTIRKPKDIVPQIMTDARVPLNKAFDKIKAAAQPVTGRINGFTLILRTFK